MKLFTAVRRAFAYLNPMEKSRFLRLISFRGLIGLLDLFGILAIGFLATSIALFLTEGSDPTRTIEIASLSLVAVNAQSLPVVAGLILILFVGKALLSLLLISRLANFLAKIEARASREVASKAFGYGLRGLRGHSKEELVFAALSGSPNAFNVLLNSAGTIVAEGILFVLILSTFAFIDPMAAIVAVIYFGAIGVAIQYFIGGRMQEVSERVNKQAVDSSTSLHDLGEVYREATILGRQEFFLDKLYDSRLISSGGVASQTVLSGMPRYIVETALLFAIAIFIGVQTLSGDIVSSAATVGIFLTGGLRLTAALLPLQGALLAMKNCAPTAARALDFLDISADQDFEQRNEVESSLGSGPVSVKLQDVCYKYSRNQKEVVSQVSLTIPAGEQAAIMGLSGAGKSTVADLVLGLLVPSNGRVELNGIEATEVLENFPGLLGYVPQKPGMVSGSIAENIALGVAKDEIDYDRLGKALADAHLGDVIAALPDGINTELGKRKDALSGGQLQRIGLARALYSAPKLLILDEATNSLDAQSEAEINKALDDLRGRVTVILVAHRLNTIQRSDNVFLLEEGRITASGRFSELLRTNVTVQKLTKLMSIESSD